MSVIPNRTRVKVVDLPGHADFEATVHLYSRIARRYVVFADNDYMAVVKRENLKEIE